MFASDIWPSLHLSEPICRRASLTADLILPVLGLPSASTAKPKLPRFRRSLQCGSSLPYSRSYSNHILSRPVTITASVLASSTNPKHRDCCRTRLGWGDVDVMPDARPETLQTRLFFNIPRPRRRGERRLSQSLPKIAGMAGPARFSGFAHPSRSTLPLTRTRQVHASGYAPSLGSGAITEAYRARQCDGGIDAQSPVGHGAHLDRSSKRRSLPSAPRQFSEAKSAW